MSGLEGLLTGQTLVKRYRIQEVIGRGGFAAVYRADDERLGRQVAVKVITIAAPDAEAAQRHRERFEREARAAASLPQHPNVVTVYDFGIDPALGLDFLVMEFLHGEDLATRLQRDGKPALDLSLRILREAATGIAVGHRAGIVHRDVKPGNIYLANGQGADDLRVCILDFGIARIVSDDRTLTSLPGEGTPLSPAYASPEQTRGATNLTPASDVFSLGVVAYQLLTGEKPFPPQRSLDPANWIPRRTVRELNADVPAPLEAVVRRALEYEPGARYPDADQFAAALAGSPAADKTVLAGPAVAAPVAVGAAPPDDDQTLFQTESEPPAIRERQRLAFNDPPPRPRKSRAGPIAFILLLLAGGAAGFWFINSGGPARRPAVADPSAQADLEIIAEGEETETEVELSETPRPDQSSPAPEASVIVTPVPIDTSLLVTFDPDEVQTGGSPADSSVAPLEALPDPEVTRPPPRVIGIPVDSIR